MVEPTNGGGERGAGRGAYFVIRVRRNHTGPGALTGTLERLGSGRARHFNGAEELLHLLTDGAGEEPGARRTGSD